MPGLLECRWLSPGGSLATSWMDGSGNRAPPWSNVDASWQASTGAWPGLADDAAGDVTAWASAGQHTSLAVRSNLVCTAYQRTRQELDCCTCWATWRCGGVGSRQAAPPSRESWYVPPLQFKKRVPSQLGSRATERIRRRRRPSQASTAQSVCAALARSSPPPASNAQTLLK